QNTLYVFSSNHLLVNTGALYGNSSINRGKDPFQSYFHRRGAKNAKKFLLLFFAERAKNNKSYPAGRTLLFLCRPLNGKGKNIILCALCVSAVKSLFIRLPLFIEQTHYS
ncbi:MAG: hypothetical protein KJ573_07295, partial [Proteobacteria bacterium]|nr:hypothetical protein [Pseudomonadota bacterium]